MYVCTMYLVVEAVGDCIWLDSSLHHFVVDFDGQSRSPDLHTLLYQDAVAHLQTRTCTYMYVHVYMYYYVHVVYVDVYSIKDQVLLQFGNISICKTFSLYHRTSFKYVAYIHVHTVLQCCHYQTKMHVYNYMGWPILHASTCFKYVANT